MVSTEEWALLPQPLRNRCQPLQTQGLLGGLPLCPRAVHALSVLAWAAADACARLRPTATRVSAARWLWGRFNTPSSSQSRSRQNKGTPELNWTNAPTDLEHATQWAECTLLSSAVSGAGHVSSYKTDLTKFKKIKSYRIILSEHKGVKLEDISKRNSRNITNARSYNSCS